MSLLPSELIEEIMMKCDLFTLLNLSKINKIYFELAQNPIFTQHKINYCEKIKKYKIHSAQKIKNTRNLSNEEIIKLPNLIELNLTYNEKITDEGLKKLYNLTELNLKNDEKITNR